jgi:alpha-L-arabinofuranosidase
MEFSSGMKSKFTYMKGQIKLTLNKNKKTMKLKSNYKKVICAGLLMLLYCSMEAIAQTGELVINVKEKGASVASSMYGIFFEEINHAGDGGLYGELVKNRSFEELEMPPGYTAKGDRLVPVQIENHVTGKIVDHTSEWTTEPVPGWSLNVNSSVADMKLTKENPRYTTAPNNLKISIADGSKPVSLINEGYWGMGIQKDEKYDLRVIIKISSDYKGVVTAKLLTQDGSELASATLTGLKANNKWNDLRATLTSKAKDPKAKLALEFKGKGTVYLDYVSLFPEKTFHNRENGLRNDVAQMLAGLKPGFIRWPGGCVVEGITTHNRFEWKKTLGDHAERSGEYSLWGYRNTYGFGYYELLQFCEDIGADAMFVGSVGIGCQYRMGDACSAEKIEYYLDDCLDAIEYALGDINTEWGAKRAAAGHPKPFPLRYVEIGNENWGDEYDKRFDIFYKAIKARYPQLTLISNHGTGGTGKIAKTDMIDPHWYVSPDFFFENAKIFDSYPRGKHTVYVGEYACNNQVGAGNMMAALSEAAFASGMERNGDLVQMASYAPLIENSNNRNWPVNLIWLNSDQVIGRSSYYVQKMFSENKPSYNLKTNVTESARFPKEFETGSIGLGTYSTQAEYKDIRITQGDKSINLDVTKFRGEKGKWNIENGVLIQTSSEKPAQGIFSEFKGKDFTLEFKARKTGGNEGFLIYFAISDNGENGFAFNVGGWNNTSTAIHKVSGGSLTDVIAPKNHSIEANKWYDMKLVVKSDAAILYVDGKEVTTLRNASVPGQFYAAGYDEASGEVIIKAVNKSNLPYNLNIKLDGITNIKNSGKLISIKANSGEDENSFDNPMKIFPKEESYNFPGKDFSYSFAPYSFTIMRIKADK